MIMRIIKAIETRLPLLLSGIAITLLCLASCSLSTLVAGKAITGLVRTQLQPTESKSDTAKAWQDEIKTYPFIKDWRDSLMKANALRDTFITSVDGIKLHAMYVRANPQAEVTAIVIHGHTRSAIAVAHLGYMYSHDFGYNILLPDMRASMGESSIKSFFRLYEDFGTRSVNGRSYYHYALGGQRKQQCQMVCRRLRLLFDYGRVQILDEQRLSCQQGVNNKLRRKTG